MLKKNYNHRFSVFYLSPWKLNVLKGTMNAAHWFWKAAFPDPPPGWVLDDQRSVPQAPDPI